VTKNHRIPRINIRRGIEYMSNKRPPKNLEDAFNRAIRAATVTETTQDSDPVQEPLGTGAAFLAAPENQTSMSTIHQLQAELHNKKLSESRLAEQISDLQRQLKESRYQKNSDKKSPDTENKYPSKGFAKRPNKGTFKGTCEMCGICAE